MPEPKSAGPPPVPAAPFARPAGDVLAELGSDEQRGLSDTRARERLAQYGPNELVAEKRRPLWKKFLAEFGDTLVVLLLIATGISAALWLVERDSPLPYEAIVIFAVVLLNATMGTLQEAKAESSVAALRRMAAAQAKVLRNGERRSVPGAEVVPGDILIVEEGDTVPADARLLRSVALQTAEAALTGESQPVAKDPAPVSGEAGLADLHNMIFSGTAVTYGRGKAVVTATGMQTQMGHIAGMLRETPRDVTPLQRELAGLGRRLGGAVVAIAVLMIATIFLVEDIHGFSAVFDVLLLGVALAVAAVPEGLPAVVTAVLSLGVQRMAKRNAIVRHLAAVETLGSATVIASDKTGTLTRNEMTVRTVVTASGRATFRGTGYAPDGAVEVAGGGPLEGALALELQRSLTVAERANNAVLQERDGRWTVQGDPTEGALLVAARKAGLRPEELGARFDRVGEVPFSSERKLMSTVHSDAERRERILVFTKGAPDVLLSRCPREFVGEEKRPLDPTRRAEILRTNEELAGQALRTLGVAARELPAEALSRTEIDEDLEQELVFLGLIGMIDPPRDEARSAVAKARQAGIRPVMITGDHPTTAGIIAAELGIGTGGRTLAGPEIEKTTDEALARIAREVSVFARVNPAHKLRIVKALQAAGETVAMTGDGVNDAPALKVSDIGVAMGVTGTDVSKEAADVVLTDDNFATIVAAVEEGRAIYSNIRKFLRYLLSSNMGEVMTMFFGMLFAGPLGLKAAGGGGFVLPLLATHLLWINLVSDGAPALALGMDPPDPEGMKKPPRPRKERVVTGSMWGGILFVGAITAAGTLFVLDAALPGGFIAGTGDLRHAQTLAFTTLTFFSVFTVFTSRSDRESSFKGMFSNKWLWFAVLLTILLQAAVVYVPFLQRAFSTEGLSAGDWLLSGAVASSVFFLREASKAVLRTLRPRAVGVSGEPAPSKVPSQ